MTRNSFMLVVSVSLLQAACQGDNSPEQPIPAADRQEIEKLLDEAQKKADAYSKAREIGLREAFRQLAAKPVGQPCPEKLPKLTPLPDEGATETKEQRDAFDTARWRMNVVPAWSLLGGTPPAELKGMDKIAAEVAAKGPRRDQYDRQSDMLRRLLTEGKYKGRWNREEIVKLAKEIGSDEYWGWELDVVATLKTDPTYDASDTFKGGVILGKAFLWSFPQNKVLCTAIVSATNQDTIKLRVDPNDKRVQRHQRLEDDLKNEAYRVAIENLHMASPAKESESTPTAPTAAPSASAPAKGE